MSKFKLVWKAVFGGKKKVFLYVLDCANAAIAKLSPADKTRLASAHKTIEKCLSTLVTLDWAIPKSWQSQYGTVIRTLTTLVNALDDLNISEAELDEITTAFKAVYA